MTSSTTRSGLARISGPVSVMMRYLSGSGESTSNRFIVRSVARRVAIGLRGMACPLHHGAWCDEEALMQIAARLKNAAAIHHESLGEKAFIQVSELVEGLRHKHPKEIDCPDCGTRLDAKAAISPGEEGLVGMACPNRHGAWIDQNMLEEIRRRLDIAAGVKSK